MGVGPAVVPHLPPPVPVDHRGRPLDHVPVLPEAAAVLGPRPGDDRLDPDPPDQVLVGRRVVPPVPDSRAGSRPGSPYPGSGQATRAARSIRTSWTFAALTRRAGPRRRRSAGGACSRVSRGRWGSGRCRPPKTARTLGESMTAVGQSSSPALSSRSSGAGWISSHGPSACQAARRRRQGLPDPHPISAGRSPRGRPVFSPNGMPVRACRSVIGGRPPFGEGGGSGGRSGSMIAHSSSGRSLATAVPPQESPPDSEPAAPSARFR